jgi:hypothetical protein
MQDLGQNVGFPGNMVCFRKTEEPGGVLEDEIYILMANANSKEQFCTLGSLLAVSPGLIAACAQAYC